MSRLILDLLSLSSVELNEHNIPQDRIAIDMCIDQVIIGLEAKAAEKNVTLVVRAPENLPKVIGDKDQLIQVFQNLIDNAIKYGADNTEVVVDVSLISDPPPQLPSWDGEVIKVAVTDKGSGIPAEAIPRLTERFYRVDQAKKSGISGTGLGLAIVKHIINRHRGYLSIQSEVGKGSTFSVYLRGLAADKDHTSVA